MPAKTRTSCCDDIVTVKTQMKALEDIPERVTRIETRLAVWSSGFAFLGAILGTLLSKLM